MRFIVTVVGLLFASCCYGIVSAQDTLNNDEFKKLHQLLNPQNETWKSIPWQTSLLKAQSLAAKQQKLIFIWAMDGHPLGCT